MKPPMNNLREEWNKEWSVYDLPQPYHGARDLAYHFFLSKCIPIDEVEAWIEENARRNLSGIESVDAQTFGYNDALSDLLSFLNNRNK